MTQETVTAASPDKADRARPDFIDALVSQLTPVSPAASWFPVMFAWCLGSWMLVALLISLIEPIRDGAFAGLSESPRLAIELAVGLLAGCAAIWAGLEIGVPGAPPAWRLWTPPLVLFAGWIVTVVYGAAGAIEPPSMIGRRAHCFIEAIGMSIIPLTAGFFLLRKRLMFATRRAGGLISAAAASIPAVWMQLACTADPMHALEFHLSPILVVAGFGGLLAEPLLRRHSPRSHRRAAL